MAAQIKIFVFLKKFVVILCFFDVVTGLTHSVDAKRGTVKKVEYSLMKALLLEFEKAKASIRAKVGHPFHVTKNSSATGNSATRA